MGIVEHGSMKLSEFLEDSLERTRGQVRESTLDETRIAMEGLIEAIGNIDYQKVRHGHGEQFLQDCLDKGNAPATVGKKLRHLKRLFQLAVNRGQLDNNPLQHVKKPKTPKQRNHIYSHDECFRLVKVARESHVGDPVRWDLIILCALYTGMRRGELLNLTWQEVDFEHMTVDVLPKRNTEYTWEWYIKDTEIRRLPLSKELVRLLAEHQLRQPDKYPYVFIPPYRYEKIQRLRRENRWTVRYGRCPLNNFTRRFKAIQRKAGISKGTFHDLRRTCLKHFLDGGLGEYDVMSLAGHSTFETTHRFYLSVSDCLLQRARTAIERSSTPNCVAKLLQVPLEQANKKDSQM